MTVAVWQLITLVVKQYAKVAVKWRDIMVKHCALTTGKECYHGCYITMVVKQIASKADARSHEKWAVSLQYKRLGD